MNFLAHLFLSCEREDLMVGNFIADFIRNKDVNKFSPGIQEGVYLHRKIDTYTDTHPIVLQGVRRLYPYHHKYAPVVIDVFYDFLLAHNWERYSEDNLDGFCKRVYRSLGNNSELMPEKLKRRLDHMVADDWLMGYTTYEGLQYAFFRMEQRASKPSHLHGAVESLQRDFEDLNREFNIFFPELIRYVRNEQLC
jgi:acyl carrier protein phosphodiesterase